MVVLSHDSYGWAHGTHKKFTDKGGEKKKESGTEETEKIQSVT